RFRFSRSRRVLIFSSDASAARTWTSTPGASRGRCARLVGFCLAGMRTLSASELSPCSRRGGARLSVVRGVEVVLEIEEGGKGKNRKAGRQGQTPRDPGGLGPVRGGQKENPGGHQQKDRELEDVGAGAFVSERRPQVAEQQHIHQGDERQHGQADRADLVDPLGIHGSEAYGNVLCYVKNILRDPPV